MEIGHVRTGYEQSGRELDLLHEELANRERALRDTRMRGIHEMEELERTHELRVDEFSKGQLIENQNTIEELTGKVRELQNGINCMSD